MQNLGADRVYYGEFENSQLREIFISIARFSLSLALKKRLPQLETAKNH